MVTSLGLLQGLTKCGVPVLLGYASYVVATCPCDIVPLCHWGDFHVLVGTAMALVNVNVLTQMVVRMRALKRLPDAEDDEDSNADSVDNKEKDSDHEFEEQNEEEASGVGGGADGTARK